MSREVEIIRSQLLRNHVDILGGTAQFDDPHTISVHGTIRGDHNTVTAEKIVIATGTRPARPPHVEFDDERVGLTRSPTGRSRTPSHPFRACVCARRPPASRLR